MSDPPNRKSLDDDAPQKYTINMPCDDMTVERTSHVGSTELAKSDLEHWEAFLDFAQFIRHHLVGRTQRPAGETRTAEDKGGLAVYQKQGREFLRKESPLAAMHIAMEVEMIDAPARTVMRVAEGSNDEAAKEAPGAWEKAQKVMEQCQAIKAEIDGLFVKAQ